MMLSAQMQHTAMSNVYSAIYDIDLEEKTLQGVLPLDDNRHILGQKQDAEKALEHMPRMSRRQKRLA